MIDNHIQSSEIFIYDFDDVESIKNEKNHRDVPNYFDVPEDKEEVVNLLFFKVNQIIRDLEDIQSELINLDDRIAQNEIEVDEAKNIILDAESKEEIESKIRELDKTSDEVKEDLNEVKEETEEIKPLISRVKNVMYSFIKGISKGY